jgi:hypothetical protein
MRAAMVGGTACYAGKTVEQGREQQQAAPAAPAPAGGLSEAAIAQLKELAQLKDVGVLTQAEFDAQKAQLLGS